MVRGRSTIQADSADVNAVKGVIAETVKTFGRLDVLVNNAGILHLGPISNYSVEQLDRMMAVNIKGLFVAIQEAIRHMREGGRIINVGSISSDFVPFTGFSVYAMTKGAVASYRKTRYRRTHGCACRPSVSGNCPDDASRFHDERTSRVSRFLRRTGRTTDYHQ